MTCADKLVMNDLLKVLNDPKKSNKEKVEILKDKINAMFGLDRIMG